MIMCKRYLVEEKFFLQEIDPGNGLVLYFGAPFFVIRAPLQVRTSSFREICTTFGRRLEAFGVRIWGPIGSFSRISMSTHQNKGLLHRPR